MIVLKRDSGWVDRFRAYQVVLNEEVIGKINNGEEKSFNIPKGNHKLKLVIDWCNSNSLDFTNSNNSPIKFDCGSNLRGLKLFSTIYYTFSRPEQYLWLKLRTV